MMSNYLLIYGSLITGTGNIEVKRCLQHYCKDLGIATVHGRLYDLGNYPAARPGPLRLYGRLLRVNAPRKAFKVLDFYETYVPQRPEENEFIRGKTTAMLIRTCKMYHAWIYWYHSPSTGNKKIGSGDYVNYLSQHCN